MQQGGYEAEEVLHTGRSTFAPACLAHSWHISAAFSSSLSLTADCSLSVQGLAQYGNGFLAKFEAASCANKLLEEVTLVDTPGVLSGEKQRIERTYNFIDVCGWFAARCDLILLLFDPHKLDISDEFKQVSLLSCANANHALDVHACTCQTSSFRQL